MAFIYEDRVAETTTTTGTGAVTLAGAITGYKAFSAVAANADIVPYAIVAVDANGVPTGEWETGLGTWNTGGTLSRTTVQNSSNSDAVVTFSAGTKHVYLSATSSQDLKIDNNNQLQLPESTTQTIPPAGSIYIFPKKYGERMLPSYISPSGLTSAFQPALFGNNIRLFTPQSGTTGTGGGVGAGTWTSNGTVTHPTPSNTAPAITSQISRTRYANVVTTTNQQLGPRSNTSGEQTFWRGDAAGLGGFFYFSRFIVELYPASTVRIFSGLTGASATASVCISDTVVNNTCGLWHDTTDPSSGANSFNFVTRDATTTTKQSIALSNAIAAGNGYDFYMFAKPNDTVIYWMLYDIVNNVTYTGNTSTTLPTNTVFMQPQCQMSNGTANVTVTTSAIGINRIYVESDH